MTRRTPKTDPHCIQTSSGLYYNPTDFSVADVRLDDIVASLSKICRFNGHCSQFYSVAQHSVHVAERLAKYGPSTRLHALFHDAAEAYLGDMVQPLKHRADMLLYRLHEVEVSVAIELKLGLPEIPPSSVAAIKTADYELLSLEARLFMKGAGRDWDWSPLPRPGFSREIIALSPDKAALLFWNYYSELKEELAEEEG